MKNKTLPTEVLLDQIKARFYRSNLSEKRFYQDRRMLLYALTWPASWLDQRALPITSQAYQKLISQRLEDIATPLLISARDVLKLGSIEDWNEQLELEPKL